MDLLSQLQSRIQCLETEKAQLEKTIRIQQDEDCICDWLSKFYANVLIKLTKDRLRYETWDDLLNALRTDNDGKILGACLAATGLSQTDWEACYAIKRNRNARCHPQKQWGDAWAISERMSETEKNALQRVLGLIRKHGAAFD